MYATWYSSSRLWWVFIAPDFPRQAYYDPSVGEGILAR